MPNKLTFSIILSVVFLFFNLIFSESAQCLELSNDSKISILTIGPGKQLYNSFGHSVIRIQDKKNYLDYTFNYGTFDFETPNFYMKFIRGKLKYSLSVANFQMLKEHYISENRSIYEQNLFLTLKQKQQIFNFLEINNYPENRYYAYDFFFDNCATRIRDVFEKVLKNDIKFSDPFSDPLFEKILKAQEQLTAITLFQNSSFRQLIAPYLIDKPWGALGIDLALVSSIDRKATLHEYMFLPDYLKQGFGYAIIKINGESNIPSWRQIVENEQVIFLVPGDEGYIKNLSGMNNNSPGDNVVLSKHKLNIFHPVFIFWLLFFIVCFKTYIDFRKNNISNKFDFALFLSTGIFGVFLLLLWFATDHSGTENNVNLLWSIPIHFPIAFLLLSKKKYGFTKWYFLCTGILMVLLILLWKILPQELNVALIPVILIIAVRAFYILYCLNRRLS